MTDVKEVSPKAVRATGARRTSGTGLLLALVATVVWSGSFVAARALHDTVPPVQAAFWRWIVAVAAVAPSRRGRPGGNAC